MPKNEIIENLEELSCMELQDILSSYIKEGALTISFLDMLLSLGASLDGWDSFELTPLATSIMYDKIDMFQILLEAGADLDDVNRYRMEGTSLHVAAIFGRISIMKIILQYDINVNDVDLVGWTALHIACRNKSKTIVELLLEKDADVNVKNNDGYTPLHHVFDTLFGEEEIALSIAIRLLKAGADLHAKNNDGQTPLDLAPESLRNRILEADIDA